MINERESFRRLPLSISVADAYFLKGQEDRTDARGFSGSRWSDRGSITRTGSPGAAACAWIGEFIVRRKIRRPLLPLPKSIDYRRVRLYSAGKFRVMHAARVK